MIVLGLLLTAIGLADLISGGLSGQPQSKRRIIVAIVIASVVGIAATFLLSLGPTRWLAGSLIAVTVAGWLGWRPTSAPLALTALGVGITLTIALAPLWRTTTPGILDAWLLASPFPKLAALTTPGLAVIVGIVLFQLATGNGIVRAVLDTAGSQVQRSEGRLRGGRFIGAIERLMIFSLAASGNVTAAALVVSAKSILRFPELSKSRPETLDQTADTSTDTVAEVDAVTEYFLLGSLTSWGVALAPMLLLL